MRNWLKILLIIGLVAVVYRDSFTSRFFQDDKLNLQLAATRDFLAVIPGANHFRPVSVQGFYFLGEIISGYNPLGYHLIEFVIFAGTLILIYKSALLITANKNKSILISFLYALNISLFANFYWIANSQFVIGGFLFFLCFLLFYHKKYSWLVIPTFIIGLAGNEQILTLIFILPIISIICKKTFSKNIFMILCFLGLGWIGLRTFLFKFPVNADYAISLNPITAVKTFRWYVLRSLNLPEAVKFSADWFFTGAFVLFLVALFKKNIDWRLILTGAFWFVVTLGIFIFLPNHMSAHYLTVALFGSSLIIGELLSKNKNILFLSLVLYLFLTVQGLEFLSKTHWIILKNTGPIGSF